MICGGSYLIDNIFGVWIARASRNDHVKKWTKLINPRPRKLTALIVKRHRLKHMRWTKHDGKYTPFQCKQFLWMSLQQQLCSIVKRSSLGASIRYQVSRLNITAAGGSSREIVYIEKGYTYHYLKKGQNFIQQLSKIKVRIIF